MLSIACGGMFLPNQHAIIILTYLLVATKARLWGWYPMMQAQYTDPIISMEIMQAEQSTSYIVHSPCEILII